MIDPAQGGIRPDQQPALHAPNQESFWGRHKVKILTGAAVLGVIICVALAVLFWPVSLGLLGTWVIAHGIALVAWPIVAKIAIVAVIGAGAVLAGARAAWLSYKNNNRIITEDITKLIIGGETLNDIRNQLAKDLKRGVVVTCNGTTYKSNNRESDEATLLVVEALESDVKRRIGNDPEKCALLLRLASQFGAHPALSRMLGDCPPASVLSRTKIQEKCIDIQRDRITMTGTTVMELFRQDKEFTIYDKHGRICDGNAKTHHGKEFTQRYEFNLTTGKFKTNTLSKTDALRRS